MFKKIRGFIAFIIIHCNKESALDMDGAEKEANGAAFWIDLWSYTGSLPHQIPWNPIATKINIPVKPAISD